MPDNEQVGALAVYVDEEMSGTWKIYSFNSEVSSWGGEETGFLSEQPSDSLSHGEFAPMWQRTRINLSEGSGVGGTATALRLGSGGLGTRGRCILGPHAIPQSGGGAARGARKAGTWKSWADRSE